MGREVAEETADVWPYSLTQELSNSLFSSRQTDKSTLSFGDHPRLLIEEWIRVG